MTPAHEARNRSEDCTAVAKSDSDARNSSKAYTTWPALPGQLTESGVVVGDDRRQVALVGLIRR